MTRTTKKKTGSALAATTDTKERALLCARTLDEMRVKDIAIIEVGGVLQVADYFIIGTGGSPRQLKSTADDLEDLLKEHGVRKLGKEGYGEGKWVLLDFGDVVVHLMLEEMRRFYDLDVLWGDCPQLQWRVQKA